MGDKRRAERISLPSGWVEFLPWLREVADRFNQDEIAVYAVDRLPLSAYADTNFKLGTPQDLAGLTGGRFYRGDRIEEAIPQTAMDARASYSILYYPQKWDGKYHKIRINCARKGVRIQAKEGYYAAGSKTAAEDQEWIGFRKSWQSLFDASEIGLRVAVSPSSKAPQAVHFRIRIDPADLALLQQDDHYISHLAFEFATYTTGWVTAPTPAIPVALNITEKQRIEAATNPTILEQDLVPGDSVRKVRVMVVDRGSGAIGSVTVPITTNK